MVSEQDDEIKVLNTEKNDLHNQVLELEIKVCIFLIKKSLFINLFLTLHSTIY